MLSSFKEKLYFRKLFNFYTTQQQEGLMIFSLTCVSRENFLLRVGWEKSFLSNLRASNGKKIIFLLILFVRNLKLSFYCVRYSARCNKTNLSHFLRG